MTSSANDPGRQVGGTHYQQDATKSLPPGPQHWDLVIYYGWDYFQGQITKYVMRWKDKHTTPEEKLNELLKARHNLDKYIENYKHFLKDQHGNGKDDQPPGDGAGTRSAHRRPW